MHKRFLLFLLPALALVGCGKKDISKMEEISSLEEISQYKDAEPSDTMMFYFGQMQAANFWQDAESDTLLRTEESRKAFMEGFRAGMAMDQDNEAYNKGLQLGLRLAIRLREFHDRYGIDFSKEILAASMQNSLKDDSRANTAEAQKGFYAIKDRFELSTATRENEDAMVLLAKKGSEMGFELVSDSLYAKDVTPGNGGRKFKDGDKVAVEVTASTIEGKEIVARQFPDSIEIGAGRVPRIVCLGIHTMTSGQTRSFLTTPRTLFGKRYKIYNLPSDEPVIFTVKAIQGGSQTAPTEEQN